MARKPEGTEMSVFEEIEQKEQQLKELKESAKTTALEEAQNAVARLNKLGFRYALTEEGEAPEHRVRAPRKASGEQPKRTPADKPCERCGFKTIPPHDLRSHRNGKPAFTDEDLKERGMVRVS